MNLALCVPRRIQAERPPFIFRSRTNLIGLQDLSQIQSLSTEHNGNVTIMVSQHVFHRTLVLPNVKRRLGGEENIPWLNKFCKCLIKENQGFFTEDFSEPLLC